MIFLRTAIIYDTVYGTCGIEYEGILDHDRIFFAADINLLQAYTGTCAGLIS